MDEQRALFLRKIWTIPATITERPWADKRRLARAVHRLASALINTEATAERLSGWTETVEGLADAVAAEPAISTREAIVNGSYVSRAQEHVDRIAFIGHSNPFSPPLQISFLPDRAVGRCSLDEVFQGAPGIVHGGVVAALADQICGAALVSAGESGLTTVLELRYLKPTPLHQPLIFEAWLERSEGTTHYLAGECTTDEGQVLSRYTAKFAHVAPDKFREIVTRQG
jgi:acyl-coenzyme A thioesterase PaaI-like protein